MRRSIVPLSLLVAAATAIWVLGIVGPASAARPAPRIACPVPAGAHVIVPCCPVPTGAPGGSSDVQPICCQTNPQCCPTTCCQPTVCCASTPCCVPTPCPVGALTIASSPNPSVAGRKVVVSGGFAGQTTSGAQVVLWRKLPGQSSFKQVAQTTTDSAGHYTFTLKAGAVMTDQAWYVTSNGVQSATLQQHVEAVVGLASSARSIVVGRTLVLRGHVTPSHTGETVLIEQSRGGTWHVVARVRLRRGSSFTMPRRFSQAGSVQLKAVFGGDARNDKSSSRAVKLTVKP